MLIYQTLVKHLNRIKVFGSEEAAKTTSDLSMPVTGEIIEVNNTLNNNADL